MLYVSPFSVMSDMTLVAVVLVDRHDALSPSESQTLSLEK